MASSDQGAPLPGLQRAPHALQGLYRGGLLAAAQAHQRWLRHDGCRGARQQQRGQRLLGDERTVLRQRACAVQVCLPPLVDRIQPHLQSLRKAGLAARARGLRHGGARVGGRSGTTQTRTPVRQRTSSAGAEAAIGTCRPGREMLAVGAGRRAAGRAGVSEVERRSSSVTWAAAPRAAARLPRAAGRGLNGISPAGTRV